VIVKNLMPHLINLPPFMYKSHDVTSFSLIQKLLFVLKGRIVSYVINHTNKKLFCLLMNILFRRDGYLTYNKNNYYSFTSQNRIIYFPNKRVIRHLNNYPNQLNILFESYCLDFIEFKKNDLVIDCGANVGELQIAFELKKINIDYIGFEPDKNTFECLKLNLIDSNSRVFNMALDNSTGTKNFFLDNEGGNSSLVDFGTEKNVSVKTTKLDDFKDINKKIKLLKIDAEGNEPEVLQGCINQLDNIEFISVDFGDERGIEQKTTIIEVNNFLYENNFNLVRFSEYRLIGLYKNTLGI
jgi:FkbM family methyltransferase